MPGGGCCPTGRFWDGPSAACAAVGPPECASQAVEHPEQCVPRWCLVWRTEAGDSCDAGDADCLPANATCTAQERAAACLAGTVAHGSGGCIPAGLASAGPAWGDGLAAPVGVAAPTPVAATEAQSFCDATPFEGVKPCEPGPCGPATMPAATGATCQPVGVPWTCPPGFIVVAPANQAAPANCAPDPAPCPGSGYGSLAGQADWLFVDSSAPPGGDGSASAPLAQLQTALNKAKAGQTVLLAAGTYKGGMDITKPMVVRGVCASKVRIEGGAAFALRILPDGGDPQGYALQHLTLAQSTWGLLVQGGAEAVVEDVHVPMPVDGGLWATGKGTQLTLRRAVIHDVKALSTNTGIGVAVDGGAKATLHQVAVLRARLAGLFVDHAISALNGDQVLVAHTQPALGGKYGVGMLVQSAAADLSSLRVHRNHLAGAALTLGAKVALRGAIVDATQPQQTDGLRGVGILVQQGATLQGVGVRLSGNRTSGLVAVDKKSSANLRGAVIDGTLGQATDHDGGAAVAQLGGSIALSGARVTGNANVGLYAAGKGSSVTATHTLVDDTVATALSNATGIGVQAMGGAQVRLSSVRVHRNRAMGIAVGGGGTALDAEDVLVDHTEPRSDVLDMGYGVGVGTGSTARLRQVRLAANRTTGIAVRDPGTRLVAVGLRVDHTLPRASDGWWGAGLFVHKGAHLVLYGSVMSANHVGSLNANLAGGTAVEAAGNVFEDSLPETTGIAGAGVMLVGAGDAARFSACLFRRNHAGGFSASVAGFELTDSVVIDTKPSSYQPFDERGAPPGDVRYYADGIVIDGSSRAVVARTLVSNQLRSGLLLRQVTNAVIQGCAATKGHFGLVKQPPVQAMMTGNLWYANQVQVADEQGLFVPPVPVVVLP